MNALAVISLTLAATALRWFALDDDADIDVIIDYCTENPGNRPMMPPPLTAAKTASGDTAADAGP